MNALICLSAIIVDEELLVTAARPQRVGGLVAHVEVRLGMAASEEKGEKYKADHPARADKVIDICHRKSSQRDFSDKKLIFFIINLL